VEDAIERDGFNSEQLAISNEQWKAGVIMKKKRFVAGMLALALSAMLLALTVCDGNIDNNNDDALYELAGRWYNNLYDFAFEITQAGEGYIAESRTQCAVSVSGSFVYFRDSHSTVMGSFSYSVKNGELTMTLGRGDFSDMPSSSPFIKSGAIPSGGAVPVEFIGKWYAKSNPPTSSNFEITKYGIMTISGSSAHYTAIVQGNKIAVLESSILKGEFQYSFIYGEMIVTNATEICEGLSVLSPFVKRNGGTQD
jgi:hypothetical protein